MALEIYKYIGLGFVRIFLPLFVFGAAFILISRPPTQAVSVNVVISEFRTRGLGGESDDFIELFNRSEENVNIGGWQVKAIQTRSTNSITVIIPNGVVLYAGSNYLIGGLAYGGAVAPDQRFVGMPDNVGIGLLTPIGALIDGVATDFSLYQEGGPLVTLVTNEDRSYQRRTIGQTRHVVDTDDNSDDFRLVSPSKPENLAISLVSAVGVASPSTVGPGDPILFTVQVTPGQFPTSTGLSVKADLSSIGGVASQTFYDDATHGDATASDNVFSFQALTSLSLELGERISRFQVADLQGREVILFVGFNIQSSPSVQCDQERLSVRTGTDSDAAVVDLDSVAPTTIGFLRSWPKPSSIPENRRISPFETTVWVINGVLTLYKLDDHQTYHLVVRDNSDNIIVAKIPCGCCTNTSSPFAVAISRARSQFDNRLTAVPVFQSANIPVRITGVGFLESVQDQTGAAPNGAELYPILDIKFDVDIDLPEIITAEVSGKKLFVNGLSFDDGAKIFLNGDKQKTAVDEEHRTTRLIGKKAGKMITRGQSVTLQVRNGDGAVSREFNFARPE